MALNRINVHLIVILNGTLKSTSFFIIRDDLQTFGARHGSVHLENPESLGDLYGLRCFCSIKEHLKVVKFDVPLC